MKSAKKGLFLTLTFALCIGFISLDSDAIGNWFKDRFEDVKKTSEKVGKGIKDTGEKVGKGIKKGFEATKEAIERTASDVKTQGEALIKKLKGQEDKLTPWANIPDNIKFNEATIFGSHDSFHSTAYGYTAAQTLHIKSIKEQLELGARYLDLRVWDYKNDLYLCHGSCTSAVQKALLPSGNFTKFVDILKEIKSFIDNNKQAVVIISLAGGLDTINKDKLNKAIEDSNITQYLLTPADWNIKEKKEWPTYGYLRNNNKRVILATEMFPPKDYSDKYIFWDLFAKPKWRNLDTNDNQRLLILSLGVETPSNATGEKLTRILEGKEEYKLIEGYSSDYFIRTLGFLKGEIAKAPMAKINTQLPYEFAEYIYKHGFETPRGEILWKNQWPNIVASDFIAQGDLSGAVQCINKNLRKINYNINVSDCSKYQ